MRRGRRAEGENETGERRLITCARPECSRVAAVRLVIDVGRRVVTMDLLVDEVGGAASLCSLHADKVIPPREWTLEDHREMVPRLFKVGQVDGASTGESVGKSSERGGVFDADEVLEDDAADGLAERVRKRSLRRSRARALSDDDEVDTPSMPTAGQLSFDGEAYDLPGAYIRRQDPGVPVSEPSVADSANPNSEGTPMLARAFDAGRSRSTPSHLSPNRLNSSRRSGPEPSPAPQPGKRPTSPRSAKPTDPR
jgi:hypothetical protein